MRIFSDILTAPDGSTNYTVGRVGIRENQIGWSSSGTPVEPASLLHIGRGWPINAGGHRSWMDVGTYTVAGTDMMYVGLKQQSYGGENTLWTDFMDAIVCWGDNDIDPDNFNDLRFVFTIPTGGVGDAATNEGLEIARMAWNGNVGIGS